jgi:hypothetical protein
MNTPPTLDRFEAALLDELRAHVATRPATEAPTPLAPRRSRRRRWAAGLAVAAAAATAYVVVSPGGPAVSPAYAVSENADGDVVVTIHRLEDSDGLERALREHGIDAEVSFDPDDSISHELTFPDSDGEAPPPPDDAEGGTVERHDLESAGPELEFEGGGDQVTEAEPSDIDGDPAGCGTGEPATLVPEGDDWVLTIPADSPLQDRKVQITTGPEGNLTAAYAGDEPDSYCAVSTLGAPVSE